jgi:hypothetical protein
MLIKKKGEKPLRYKNNWFVSAITLHGKTYYSRDGFTLSSSRTDRLRMEDLVRSSYFQLMSIYTIENDKGEIMSLGDMYSHISISIENRVLTLTVKAR